MASCLACHCTDAQACPGGCAWVLVNHKHGIGVCSRCDAAAHRATYRQRNARWLGKRAGTVRVHWTPDELRTLTQQYADMPSAALATMLGHPLDSLYRKACELGLNKSAAYLKAYCRLQPGSDVGAAGRFPKGHVPANKGLRRPGWAPGRMAETQFKKGQLAGGAQANWVPIGTEVFDDEGYLKKKVSDDRDKPSRFNWRYVHRLVWESAHGPIPPGYSIKFIDGDRRNVKLENLCLVSRLDLMRLNTLHNYPKEITHLIQLRGALNRQINKRTRHENSHRAA